MHDERGLYYYPDPANPKARVYVRRGAGGGAEFRLWHTEHAHVWEQHEWLPEDVLRAAADMYISQGRSKDGVDPLRLYDSVVAHALLKEAGI